MKIIFIILVFLFAKNIDAQDYEEISLAIQVYPTGIIPGLRLTKSINSRSSVFLRLGYNRLRHGDNGVHDDERGGGFGGSLGYLKYLNNGQSGWHFAVKTDVWFNDIDWMDDSKGSSGTPESGHTSITVLQPTVEIGYSLTKEKKTIITPTVALGFEWNVRTTGAPTGQGAILLIGLQVGRRF